MKRYKILILGLLFSCQLFSQENDTLKIKKIEEKIVITEEDQQRVKSVIDEAKKKGLDCLSEDTSITTTFYDIFVTLKLSQNTYKLPEVKKINLGIYNRGCKDFFVPEYLKQEFGKRDELFIEIYKKNKKGDFVIYESNATVHIQGYDIDRKVYALKNMQSHCFGDLKLDLLNPIKEEGTYYVKVYLDLSNFGYFKKIETSSTVFEVVE